MFQKTTINYENIFIYSTFDNKYDPFRDWSGGLYLGGESIWEIQYGKRYLNLKD